MTDYPDDSHDECSDELHRCKSVDDVCESRVFCRFHKPARVRVFDNDKRER